MIGGLLDKVSASLGKSFIFAGLLPAAVLLLVFNWYSLGIGALWTAVPSLADDLKKITALGVTWLGIAFVLFAVRTWIFDWFQRMPQGPLAPLLLRRSLLKRDEAENAVRRLEWQFTVVQWRDFDPDNAVYRPPSYPLPKVAFALERSKVARSRLNAMAPSVVHPGYGDCRILLNGLCAIFAITTDKHIYKAHKDEIDAELAAWRDIQGERATTILDNLQRHVQREWAAAFEHNLQYSKGPWVYPTAIGNRLAALDDYAERRYRISTAAIWDRLWWVLPSTSRQEVADARLTVETLINLLAVLLLCAIATAVALLCAVVPWSTDYVPPVNLGRILLGAGCLIFAIGCYRGAVFAIKALTTKMMTLIDTNRLQLLAALGYSVELVREEVEAFTELNAFFVQARSRQSERKLKIPKSGDAEKQGKSEGGEKKKKNGEEEE